MSKLLYDYRPLADIKYPPKPCYIIRQRDGRTVRSELPSGRWKRLNQPRPVYDKTKYDAPRLEVLVDGKWKGWWPGA